MVPSHCAPATWKTVRKDPTNDSNLDLLDGGWNFPPKSWAPSMANMEMKRIRRTRSETMADMESRSDLTRRDMELQYLRMVRWWLVTFTGSH